MQKHFLLTLAVLLISSSVLEAQQQNQSSGQQGSSDLMNLYTDEIGLRLISTKISLETYIDRDTYILGPFDALTVTIRGPVPVIMRGIVVNPLGEMILPSVGNVNVRGLTINEAQTKVKSEVGRYYRTNDVTLTLDIPRPVSVHILGEAPRPGLQRIPAMTRVDMLVMSNILTASSRRVSDGEGEEDNDLYTISSNLEATTRIQLANTEISADLGDPRLQNYSLRNVRIEHENGTTSNADLVGYYYSGRLEFNPAVQSGDRVFLNRRYQNTPRIAISGMVNRPFETEYRADDTISKLLEMAGGFDQNSDKSGVIVFEATSTGIDSVFIRAANFDTYILRPNSRVVVQKSDLQQFSQSTWVSGEVNSPGIYPIHGEETTLYELLQRAGGITDLALLNGAFLERVPTWDSEIAEVPDSRWESGLIQRTADIYAETVESLYLERITSLQIIPVDLRDIESLKRFKLRDNDKLIIPRDRRQISIIGQVNRTGFYPFEPGTSVTDYIRLAGGYALAADQNRVFVIKASSKAWYKYNETTLESGDMIYVDRFPTETLANARQYEMALRQQRTNNLQLIIAGVSAFAGILTTFILLNNR